MLFKEISSLLRNRLSPEEYIFENEFYGLEYGNKNSNNIIKRVMLSLDLNLEAIHFATLNRVNFIISYRGLINEPLKNFNQNLVNKLSLLSKYPLNIFVLNSSFVAAEGGISDTILDKIYLTLDKTFDIINKNNVAIPIGRICLPKKYPNQIQSFTLQDLLKRIKVNLEVDNLCYVGELNTKINRICLIGAKLPNLMLLERIISQGCDCLISCDFNYKEAMFAKDIGLTLIKIPHYHCEIKAMKRLSNTLSLEFPNDEIFLYESKNPLNVY
ncbi:MAG: Nif3-like dinuclear metal center hexameric protein [Promethearchaeota archaeon]